MWPAKLARIAQRSAKFLLESYEAALACEGQTTIDHEADEKAARDLLGPDHLLFRELTDVDLAAEPYTPVNNDRSPDDNLEEGEDDADRDDAMAT